MIHILRKKLIGATMVSLTLVLLIILGAVNIVSFHKTVMDADRIVVMDGGKIVDVGRHQELMQRCVPYQEIYYSQFPKEAADNE